MCFYVVCRFIHCKSLEMDDQLDNDKKKGLRSETAEDTKQNETSNALRSQIDDLKRELESTKKKLQKSEFELESARRNVTSLKSEVKELNKKFHEERKKNARNRCSECAMSERESKPRDKENTRCSETSDIGTKDLRASLEEAAASAMTQSGFVYDNRTGLYYDWNTGYYYDPQSRLYYENTTGTYYYYDDQSNSYKFHYKVELSNYKDEKTDESQFANRDEKESGEESSSEEEEGERRDENEEPEVIEVQFPCIRAIVISSAKIEVGSLFIVTYQGGTVGREKDRSHVIRINDFEVSKEQCKIEFDKERRQFFIRDVGSRNGTFLNGTRLSESKQESEYHVITHGDELTVGATTLLLHVHPGSQTCDACEPGQVQAQAQQRTSISQHDEVCITRVVQTDKVAKNSSSVQAQMKSELKRLKKAYGLEDSSYCEQAEFFTSQGKYKDRAEVRRTKVGSDTVVEIPDEPAASIHRPIGTANIGRQMLEKLGWKEGEGLGREGTGRREPVMVELREDQRGLGAGVKRSIDDVNMGGKSYLRAKMRERFEQISPAFSHLHTRTTGQSLDESNSLTTNVTRSESASAIDRGPDPTQVTQEFQNTKRNDSVDIFAE